MSKFYWVNAC